MDKIPAECANSTAAGGRLKSYEVRVGGKVPQLTNDQRSDAKIYAFAL